MSGKRLSMNEMNPNRDDNIEIDLGRIFRAIVSRAWLAVLVAVLGGIVIKGVVPTTRETLGCVIMFAAIVVAQLDFPKKEKRVA